MAAKDRMAVLSAMMDQGVISVFYHPDAEICKKVIQACANGGAKCIEFTNRGDFAIEVFSALVKRLAQEAGFEFVGASEVNATARPSPYCQCASSGSPLSETSGVSARGLAVDAT